MRYEIVHKSTYRYASDVSVSHHLARVTPRELPRQRCEEHRLAIDPSPSLAVTHEDYFGNRATFFSVEGKHRVLGVTARSQVEVVPPALPSPPAAAPWEAVRDLCRVEDDSPAADAHEFVFDSPLIPRLAECADYAASSFAEGRPLLDAILDLTRRIHGDFTFDPRATTVATPLGQVIRNRRGVCQDFAHFQIGCLRALGLPARYVSGYLETLPPPGKTKLVGADASHAWVQTYLPDFGWIDVDPTNNVLPSDRHITLAWGRDFNDVSPIRGLIVGGGKHALVVGVDVSPIPATSASQGNDAVSTSS